MGECVNYHKIYPVIVNNPLYPTKTCRVKLDKVLTVDNKTSCQAVSHHLKSYRAGIGATTRRRPKRDTTHSDFSLPQYLKVPYPP